jgi:membrane-associated protease RseP (regulator of RpoE activity)
MRQNWDFDHQPWFLVPVRPGADRRAKKWNVWLISALIFVVIGVFVMTTTPELGHAAASGMHHAALSMQGVQVQNLKPSVAQDLGIPAGTHGVAITSADPSSAAAAAGLQSGDVIQEVNRKPVRNVREYEEAVSQAHGQSILLLVNRGGATHFIVVEPQ